jgi:hypothetical protein
VKLCEGTSGSGFGSRVSATTAALFFLGRTGASPFGGTERWDEGEVCRITSLPGFDNPTDAVQEHGT